MSNENLRIARISDRSVASLQDYSEGDWVEYSDGNYGGIVGKVDGPVEWPTGDEEVEEVGEDGETVYIVARGSGGSKPFTADELDSAERSDVIDTDEVPDQPEEDIDEAEMAQVYYRVDDAHDYEELQSGLDELLSVPGVDDPGVGFDSWPDSWEEADEPARLIALDSWTSMGGTWTGCVAEIGSKRLCSAFKDEILGTERWRGRF
jgi:hypothetical protein